MATKIKKLDLKCDYRRFLYFVDGAGNVCRKTKTGEGEAVVLVKDAVKRDPSFLYFIDKDGDLASTQRLARLTRKG